MAKAKSEPNDKAQSKRFIEKARELEADESGEVFERTFKKIIPPNRYGVGGPPKKDRRQEPRQRSS